jgi:hypothetical protein
MACGDPCKEPCEPCDDTMEERMREVFSILWDCQDVMGQTANLLQGIVEDSELSASGVAPSEQEIATYIRALGACAAKATAVINRDAADLTALAQDTGV